MDIDNSTVIAQCEVTFMDGAVEVLDQQLGGDYQIHEGVMRLVNHDETEITVVPLNNVRTFKVRVVENVEEIKAALAAKERKDRHDRVMARRR